MPHCCVTVLAMMFPHEGKSMLRITAASTALVLACCVGAAAQTGTNGFGTGPTGTGGLGLSNRATVSQNSTFVGGTSGGFVGQGAAAGNNFGGLGTQQIATLGLIGGLGSGFGGGFGGRNGGGGFGQGQLGNNANSARSQLRIPFRAGFVPPTPANSVIESRFINRLTKLPGLTELRTVSVRLDGTTAILVGSVPTAEQKELLATLARLEPGIAAVRNDLRVDVPLSQP